MQPNPAESLPLPRRLALSYAPRSARDSVLTLMLLDERLATILRQKGEVMIAQVKLAWWRDRLAEDKSRWPAGEPLLDRLREGALDATALVPLVDGWERLLGDALTISAIEEFAAGRASAWCAVATAHDAAGTHDADAIARTARQYSLADLAMHLDDAEERRAALELARVGRWSRARLPRCVRPLAVLHALAGRALDRGGAELLDGPGAVTLALRTGLFGR